MAYDSRNKSTTIENRGRAYNSLETSKIEMADRSVALKSKDQNLI